MKSILHIGADKCGSSSIQRSFTINSILENSQGEIYKYRALRSGELLFENEINIFITITYFFRISNVRL